MTYLITSKIPLEQLLNAALHRRLYVGGGVTVPLDRSSTSPPAKRRKSGIGCKIPRSTRFLS
jgi:hypothetical protein